MLLDLIKDSNKQENEVDKQTKAAIVSSKSNANRKKFKDCFTKQNEVEMELPKKMEMFYSNLKAIFAKNVNF